MIDLRSDTVTKPTPEMLEAMTSAEVGDDVFGEDPTVNKLEEKIASLFGMGAGLFVPSGTMSNQLAVKVLTGIGDEVLMDEQSHIFNYESTAAALLSSVQIHPLKGKYGKLNPPLIHDALRGGQDWEPNPAAVVLENSTNKGGGACYNRDELETIKETASSLNLRIHLDGARVWNAITATGVEAHFFGDIADTMTVCFSKGLGAPVGSMLLSNKERIRRARKFRKMMGGGMRQVGILAAAADYAVDHHWPLMKEDHRRARRLAETIANCSDLKINLDRVQTNIIIFDVKNGTAEDALERLKSEDVLMVPFGPKTIRATFHYQVDDEGLDKAQEALKKHFG